MAFWAIIVGMARSTAEEGSEIAGSAAGPFALGFALVPFAFLILAFGTNNPRAPGATLRAMGFFLVFGLPLIIFIEAATGLAAGFALGAIPAIRMEIEHSWKMRLGWAIGLVLYVFVAGLHRDRSRAGCPHRQSAPLCHHCLCGLGGR